MKLDSDELARIKKRHKYDADIYAKINDDGGATHVDRAALLDHIETLTDDKSFGSRFGGAAGSVLGWAIGWVPAYLILRWLVRDDLIAAAQWMATHIRVAP